MFQFFLKKKIISFKKIILELEKKKKKEKKKDLKNLETFLFSLSLSFLSSSSSSIHTLQHFFSSNPNSHQFPSPPRIPTMAIASTTSTKKVINSHSSNFKTKKKKKKKKKKNQCFLLKHKHCTKSTWQTPWKWFQSL